MKQHIVRVVEKIKLKTGLIAEEPATAVIEEKVGEVIDAKYLSCVDGPKKDVFGGRSIVVSGWLIPLGERKVKSMRVRNHDKTFKIKHGEKRVDVAVALPDQDQKLATYCGFSRMVHVEPGQLIIEVDVGDGYEELQTVEVHSPDDKLVKALYTPDLGAHYAEHQNLMANKKRYYYEEPLTIDYRPHKNDPRLIAFYLPQFHPIPENDRAWGKNFTEWTNVTTNTPRFVGHFQPMLPKDLGLYDLRIDDNIHQQIEMAKKHGIFGFCVYYYWFSGKKLLERPVETIVKHKEWDFNFFICWANENWTKRWDGLDQDVIVAQKYLEEDPLNFIKDTEHIMLDERYIKIDGKPVLAVYRASELKDPARFAKVWREYFRKKHKQELYLISVIGFETIVPKDIGFDASIDFAPLSFNLKRSHLPGERVPTVYVKDKLLDTNFEHDAADYRKVALNKDLDDVFDFPVFKSIIPSWDNDARKKGNQTTAFHNVNPDIYAQWLDRMLEGEVRKANGRPPMMFINAWNEWAEGTVLEPSIQYGRAYLNRTTEVLAKHSHEASNKSNFTLYGIKRRPNTKLAVVAHVFYEKEWGYVRRNLAKIKSVDFDVYVTLSEKLAKLASTIESQVPGVHIVPVPNRGRDILPFLFIARRLKDAGYEYVLKLHTKRSLHREDGHDWFEDLVGSLLPSRSVVDKVIKRLDSGAAFVGPRGHWVALSSYIGSNDKHLVHLLTEMYGKRKAQSVTDALGGHGYFAGSMFWARLDALAPLLDLHLAAEDFESEQGQIDGTMAHAVERLFGLLPILAKQPIYESSKAGVTRVNKEDAQSVYRYAS